MLFHLICRLCIGRNSSGTPDVTCVEDDVAPSRTTCWDLCVRKFLILKRSMYSCMTDFCKESFMRHRIEGLAKVHDDDVDLAFIIENSSQIIIQCYTMPNHNET